MTLRGACVVVVGAPTPSRDKLHQQLADAGAQVRMTTATHASGTLASLDTEVDVVIVDAQDARGDALDDVIAHVNRARAAIVLVAHDPAADDAVAAVRVGASAYVMDPLRGDALVQAVGRVRADVAGARAAARQRSMACDMVEAAPVLLLVLDEDGRVLDANPAAASAVGAPRARLTGMSWVHDFVAPADRGAVAEVLARLAEGAPDEAHDHRILGRDAEGTPGERWIRWQMAARHDEDGRTRVHAAGMDVTENREVERRSQVARRIEAVGTLMAGLAHEVRNPLNSARLQLHVLQRRLDRLGHDPKLTVPVELALEEIDRLARLLKEFLEFARPSEVRMQRVDMCDVVRRVVDLVAEQSDALAVEMITDLPEAAATVTGDPDKLTQAVLNVVHNALEALASGGAITVRVRTSDHRVHVIVRDTGPGVADKHISRIFEPFFSTKPQGTGLGMAICHNLVRQHGGTISVRNAGGAEFNLAFPAAEPPEPS